MMSARRGDAVGLVQSPRLTGGAPPMARASLPGVKSAMVFARTESFFLVMFFMVSVLLAVIPVMLSRLHHNVCRTRAGEAQLTIEPSQRKGVRNQGVRRQQRGRGH